MCNQLHDIRTALSRYAKGFDPALLSLDDLTAVVRHAAALESTASALMALASTRLAEAKTWKKSGTRDAADDLSRQTGMTPTQARERLNTGKALNSQPALASAALAGELSPTQTSLIAEAAQADPKAAPRLIEKAKGTSVSELKDAVAATKAAAAANQEARHREIQRRRRLRSWIDRDGVWQLHASGAVTDGAQIDAALRSLKAEIFAANRQAGNREHPDAYSFDALLALAQDFTSERPSSPPASAATTPGASPVAPDPAGAPDPGASPVAPDPAGTTNPGASPVAPDQAGATTDPTDGPTVPTRLPVDPTGPAPTNPTGPTDPTVPAPTNPTEPAPSTGPPPAGPADPTVLSTLTPTGVATPADPDPGASPTDRAPEPAAPSDLTPTLVGSQTPAVAGRRRPPRPLRRGAQTKIIFRIDITAWHRGHTLPGETCELSGYGPVPVSAIDEALGHNDPFVTAVLTKSKALLGVVHLGRAPTAHQQTALEWLYPNCAALGCTAKARLERDHQIDWSKTHVTVFERLDLLCHHHHALKTRKNWALVEGRGKRHFVPPDDPRHPNRVDRSKPTHRATG